MKATVQTVLLSTFACAVLFSSAPAFADGDGECVEDPPLAKAALKRAKDAESANKPVQAFLLYERIYFCSDKNGMREVEDGKKRILVKFARAQENKGIIQTSGWYFKHQQDAHCAKLDKQRMEQEEFVDELKGPDNECVGADRAVFNESAGAFDTLWQVREYEDADNVLMKGVRSKPNDLKIVGFAVEHFSPDDAHTDHEGYTHDPANSRELRRLTAKNTEDLLAKEDKSFKDKTITLSVNDRMAGMPPVARSIKLLTEAKDWASLVGKEMTDKVVARAKQRGAEVLELDKKTPSHVNLSDAILFYNFAGDEETVLRLKATADKRGEQAAAKGEMREAAYYFGISGNEKRADELGAEVKKGFDKRNPARDIMKGDKDKRQFQKEADDLEKELGI